MRKIILYIATSLNGYIAKANGDVDWLDTIPKPENDDYGFQTFLNSVDTTIQGNNTYRQIVNWGIEFPYQNTWNYVLTRNNNSIDNENITYIKKNHIEFISELKNKQGKNIWLLGGGQTNALLLNNHLIDEVYQFLMPVVIEDGIKLFETVNDDIALNIIDTKVYESGVIRYRYKVIWS